MNATIMQSRSITRIILSTLLASALAACASDDPVVGDGDDDPGDEGPDDPGDPDDPGTQPMDATGSYQLDSTFDLVSSMPGTVGLVTNAFVEMTDDPYDPATWLIDTLLEEWDGPGWAEGMIQNVRPYLDGVINDLMMDHAPELVAYLIDIGDAFGQVTRQFGIDSTLAVSQSGDGLVAVHSVDGYRFEIDDADFEFSLEQLGADPVAVESIGIALESNVLSVSEHGVPLRYGGFLAMVLEEVIIPMVTPGADGLADLLDEMVDCYAIGSRISEELDWGSPEFYEGLCDMGLQAGANFALDKLISIDEQAQVTLEISGRASTQDQNSDRQVDHLTGGTWNGAIDYAGSRGDLVENASTFSGQRM